MSRETFLARVKAAAAAGRAHRVHLREHLSERVGPGGAGGDLVERLLQEVDAVGGRAHHAADLDEARRCLEQLLAQYAPRTALCWRHALLDRMGLKEVLNARNISRLDYDGLSPQEQAAQRTQMFQADVGISSVTAAIAETGTLALFSRPGQERLASLLPPVHIAVVEAAQIVSDLFDFFASLQAGEPEQLPSNCTLITGPSKTGDIELTLTTGVHGPGKWHVIAIQ